ncbi:RNA polymerase factor sigma-54 [Motiliproteus sediminis]|uniref:RNA polymerase factor sigma-54 n=1 Tax=Motiliproteus sediminis TaxID=1468178 RepID=UPI001AF00A84|nr:RNA polymerase factor sigma-54 [Motiliproteus sediminis]
MKPSLQLKISQQLTMTPQLQQAIRLLQLSTLDLQQEIQEALEANPMLEVSEDSPSETDNNDSDTPASESAADKDTESDLPDEWNEQIPVELSTDSDWEDTYQSASPPSSGSAPSDGDMGDFESADRSSESLLEYLTWQLNLTPMSDLDRALAMALIDGIDDDGYLRVSLDDVITSANEGRAIDAQELVEMDEAEAVLRRIQQFDPPGIAARDLRECLLIQLDQLPADSEWLQETRLVVGQYLHLLGSHDYKQLMRRSKLKEEQLQAVIRVIHSLNPRPGSAVAFSEPEYVIPDVLVRKERGAWRVSLNQESMPRLRINNDYAGLVKRADNSSDNTYLRNHLQEARWFLKSLQSRNETLLKVASKIVEYQQDFLEYGEEAMKPLVLHDIAQAVEMHESTISRVTTQKFMHTPRGIFELKYFFSSHVSTASGGECSSTAIRAIIKKLVAAENIAKPLSDSKIANLLEEQGIQVARRTIAKYREAMNIPPSNERKRLV